MKVSDGEGYDIRDRWQEAAAPAHKVLCEGHLCVETKAEATAPASAAKVPAAASASRMLASLLDIVITVVLVI